MSKELNGHVVIVTGAAGAIGSATANLLAERGASLVLTDLSVESLTEVSVRCTVHGGQVWCLAVNQQSTRDIEGMIAEALQRFDRVDALINNAGVWDYARIEETSDELWWRILDVNLTGTFRCCRAAVPVLRKSGRGSIVNVSSVIAFRGVQNVGAYAASKGGIVSFSRVLAAELAPEVRVNVVAPGHTETPTHARMAKHEPIAAQGTLAATEAPMGRMAYPEEVAEAIAFAVSPRARFMTGSTLHVNGGRFMP